MTLVKSLHITTLHFYFFLNKNSTEILAFTLQRNFQYCMKTQCGFKCKVRRRWGEGEVKGLVGGEGEEGEEGGGVARTPDPTCGAV
jgi:hypothetical protein